MGIKIIGTGKKLPKHVVTNEALAAFLDTSDEWITSKTGIKTRTVCTEENLTDLAEEASRTALTKAGILMPDVDMLICATMTGDYHMPSMACCILERLGGICPAFDISAACSGFVYALDVADSFISAGKAETILIVAAEMMSRMVDWNDRTSGILFGDGACACLVTKGNALKYIHTTADAQVETLFTKAGRGNNPFIEESDPSGYLEMQGQQVYKFAVKTIEKEIHLALNTLNMKAEDVDYFILHQANTRIIDGARIRLQLPADKFPMNIERYGNMSAASIPILLDEMIDDGRIKTGDILMLIGFGAGMTAGTAVLEWEAL